MKRLRIIVTLSVLISSASVAQELTTCRNASGKAFYHDAGLTDTKSAGWADDAIKNGVVTLIKLPTGEFDMLYIDVRGKPISMTQDGALIRVLRQGKNEISLIAYYEGAVTEIYTFFNERSGKTKFTLATIRVGDLATIPKSSLMIGECSLLRMDQPSTK